jgi:hypothetical protein
MSHIITVIARSRWTYVCFIVLAYWMLKGLINLLKSPSQRMEERERRGQLK